MTASAEPRRVAYLINQYPAVSHTFIRREILALERMGITVDRIALRGWDATLVDQADLDELEKTRFVLKDGVGAVLKAMARMAVKRPGAFAKALKEAMAMSRNAIRPLPYHLIYLAQACRIRDWIDETGATHLHAHFGTNSAEIAYLVHLLDGPEYSFTIHGQDEIEGAKRLHFPRKIGHARFVASVSAYCRAQILREIPVEHWDKMKVIHCGLDETYFAPETPPFPESPRFLSVARISPEKGHLILLDAFAEVYKENPEARLTFAGDGDMRPMVETRIAELELADAVEITGWVDAQRVQAELARASVLVQPSFIEGLPVVIMEAMARHRPIVSTYVAGIPELVTPDVGWLVPAGDVPALADAMKIAISADSGTLSAMGRAAATRAKERHLVDNEAAKLAAGFFGEAS